MMKVCIFDDVQALAKEHDTITYEITTTLSPYIKKRLFDVRSFIIGICTIYGCLCCFYWSWVKTQSFDKKFALKVGLFFGLFQALMPLVGHLASIGLGSFITEIDHWVAFVL